jgi:hypothetical protein
MPRIAIRIHCARRTYIGRCDAMRNAVERIHELQAYGLRCYMPRRRRTISVQATMKTRSETDAERIVNADDFGRNTGGVLKLTLWRDYVIATLPVDGRIVFCFAQGIKSRLIGRATRIASFERGYVSRADARLPHQYTALRSRFVADKRARFASAAINSGMLNSRVSGDRLPGGSTGADCSALRYNVQCRRESIRQHAAVRPVQHAVRRALPR